MPTYVYSCTDCSHTFEVQQSFSDDALTSCVNCSGRLRKVFNSVGIVFKGSGFYRTDSRSGPKTDRAEKSDKTDKTPADSGASNGSSGGSSSPTPASSSSASSTASSSSGSSGSSSGSAA